MKNLRKPVGVAILSLFVATGVVFLSQPIILTHAETATSDVNLNIGAVMSLSLDADSLDLSTTPHHFVSGTINATVSTNSQYGYTLTIEDVDDNTDLAHTNTGISDSFKSNISGSKTSSEMEDNTWGFSLNATDFYKVPVNGSPVALKRTTNPMTAAAETVPVTFGAMVGNIVSGAYTDGVLFTMYTNGADGKPSDGTDPSDPGIATDACTGKNYVTDYVLTDPRDGNTYTVAPLADGKCWMMDNLRLINKTITSENSNLPDGESFTIPASSISSFSTQDTNGAYYDETYGSYYTFYTATAGWGRYASGSPAGNSPKDICPKGWRLPSAGNTTETSDYLQFRNMYAPAERNPALNPTYAGEIIDGRILGAGSYVSYYTSTIDTPYGGRYAISMYLANGYKDVDTSASYKTYIGNPVRCLAD